MISLVVVCGSVLTTSAIDGSLKISDNKRSHLHIILLDFLITRRHTYPP